MTAGARRAWPALMLGAWLAGAPATAADNVGVYCMIEHEVTEPADASPQRVQIWGVFAFADRKSDAAYGAVQRGYMYYTCPLGKAAACRDEWADLRWFVGTGKGVGYGSRATSVGRLRKSDETPAAPDPYPLTGGPVKIESKAPEYIDLAARLKAALTAPRAPSTRPSPTSPGRTSR